MTDDERRQRQREASQRWRLRHPEKVQAYQAATAQQRREYQRRYYQENRAKWPERQRRRRVNIREERDALKAGPCTDCGGTFPPECMDWDHLPGTAKAQVVSRLEGASPRALAEIAKCDLVCANCHRVRSRKRQLAKKVAS